ncbi:MAG: ATP-grasp domain-containing protein [Deltaproteobacteria bacterium]|nr:ATP-grasp domain-containing protein [Deltaproteobacteria bacterium]
MGNQILITGIGGPAGKSALTYFKGKGATITGTDVREVDLKADTFHIVPMATGPAYQPALLDIIKKERPSLFIPTVTEELSAVARLKGEIEGLGCLVYISPPEAVDIANDKFRTAEFMKKNGISVPVTFNGKSPRELVIKELGLPLLAKPNFGRGGRGVVVYRSAEEVYSEKREGLIFQEFVPGDEFDVNLFIDKGGEPKAAVALKKTILKEGIVGNALGVERVKKDDIIEICKRASRLLGLEGPLDFDIRLRNNGEPALLEINARLGGNSLFAEEVLDGLMNSWKRRIA